MSEFEPCPISGNVPKFSSGTLRYTDGLGGTEFLMASAFVDLFNAARWWNDSYVPAVRKLIESQKPVEFHVGDTIGFNLRGYEWLILEHGSTITGETEFVVTAIDGDEIALDQTAYIGDSREEWDPKMFRLISRPAKLTLADIPKIEGINVSLQLDDDGYYVVFEGGSGNGGRDESEAVADGLNYLNKIWAAKPEGV